MKVERLITVTTNCNLKAWLPLFETSYKLVVGKTMVTKIREQLVKDSLGYSWYGICGFLGVATVSSPIPATT